MTRTNARRALLGLLWICLTPGIVVAQEHGSSSSASSSTSQPEPASKPSRQGQAADQENPNQVFSKELTKTSEKAAGEAGNEDAKAAMELKAEHSWFTSWVARVINIGPERAYVLSLLINFGILVWFFWMLLKAKIPQMFRDRTAIIRKGIQEAQAASADASRRLQQIEARLAKLDGEVAEIRSSAEKEAATEEARIRESAEEDKQKTVQSVETEIAAIARNARRELKSYAAGLAVDLAAKKIKVGESADKQLVREFVDQFGGNGK